jgi:hypothetical protein
MIENRILGLIPSQNRYYLSEIFGYTSKSLPGLEIVGLGVEGKQIKEKFVYLTKVLGLKIPRLRYVLCIENLELTKEELKDKQWLELPLLILYLQLAGILPIQKLSNCMASGKVLPSLKISEPKLLESRVKNILISQESLKFLTNASYDEELIIPLRELLRIEGLNHA